MTNAVVYCCYCGLNPATTRDHIPPKAIFTKPRPNDLITVPCCHQCNNQASALDEKFKTYLGLHVARNGGEGERLFKEGVLPTAKHNRRLRKTIFDSMKPVYTATKAGIITGQAMGVLWDYEAHEATIDRITRGLFYHHYQRIIGNNAKVEIYWFNDVPFTEMSEKLYDVSIANESFRYSYNKTEESDWDSIWLYRFYEGHFAGAMVTSPGFEELKL